MNLEPLSEEYHLAEKAQQREKVRLERVSAIQLARAKGEQAIVSFPRTGGLDDDRIPLEDENGPIGYLFAGEVMMSSPPGRSYDYDVDIEVLGEMLVEGDVVKLRPSSEWRAYARSITVLRRKGGPDIGSRQLQKEQLSEVVHLAIRELSLDFKGVPLRDMSEKSAKGLSRSTPADVAADLEIVVAAAQEYAKHRPTDINRREYISQKLKARGRPGSDGRVKELIKMCKERGMLPQGQIGRPRKDT